MTRAGTVVALGGAQTLAWASSYYLPAVLAVPMARDLGVSAPTVFAAFSVALVVSAILGPWAGRTIDRLGGRSVLTVTNVLFATGLGGLAAASGPWSLFGAWLVLGLAMGSGLYEAAFATLVRLYGQDSRNAITGVTLIAGFASTVGWPLSAYLEVRYGWRTACLTWAAAHVLLGIPLNASLPRSGAGRQSPPRQSPDASRPPGSSRITVLLTFVFAATWFISTAMAAHLPRLLQAAGATLTSAVAVGALVGPAQVAARLLQFGLLRRVHPVVSARLAALMHPLGVAVLALGGVHAAPVFGLLHGAGNGILTIAKGTLPLVLFGPHDYGHRQGVLSVPARFAQALAPWIFGICIDRWGDGALAVSAAVAMLAFGALMLVPAMPQRSQVTASAR